MTLPPTNRILVVAGHYGSGKTEFCVSLAVALAKSEPHAPLALVDLDIVNPYFRSREVENELNALGVNVYASMYKGEIAAEIPALGAEVRAPLENADTRVIIDCGGNDAGALVLRQFGKYLTPESATLACVVNFNRFETRTVADAVAHVHSIETATKLPASYIINNTHLLRETTADTILRGHELAVETATSLDTKMFCTTYPVEIANADELSAIADSLFPVGMYLRKSWHDK
ncbi:MAG: ATP-binding protein [Oscillospiraceae bacterium]|jgi:RecA/RadA recombinase|nr:ATP-binding protein [Oscillospiraceae bacterium]